MITSQTLEMKGLIAHYQISIFSFSEEEKTLSSYKEGTLLCYSILKYTEVLWK